MTSRSFACPVCGERQIVSLVFAGENIVQCSACATLYDPHTGKIVRRPTPGPDDVWSERLYQED